MRKKNRELQNINQDLDTFFYIASHDLKSPVSNLEGLIQILLGTFVGKLNSEEKEVLKMTEGAVGRLKKTIEGLLEVVRIQKEANGVQEQGHSGVGVSASFKEVTQEVKEDLQSLIVGNQATIIEDFSVKQCHFRRVTYGALFTIFYPMP